MFLDNKEDYQTVWQLAHNWVNTDPDKSGSNALSAELKEVIHRPDRPYQVHDLLSNARFLLHGPRNYVELDPRTAPAHIFRLRRRVRSERDFDYYL